MKDKKEQWFESGFELSNGKKFSIVHNISQKGNINSIHAAFEGWLARTKSYTAKSFVNYINSKGENIAMTKKDYDKLNKTAKY